MASFDKFIEDLERRQAEKQRRAEALQRAHEESLARNKVMLYSEKWQNNIRYHKSGGTSDGR